MAKEVTSKHLRNATELTLVADVRPGFVDTLETRSYATRIGILLRTLYAIRQGAIEASLLDRSYEGPLEKLQALHFVRWSLLENGRRLMLAVSFDGPWEPYMRRIADVAGPLLDVILCSCEGYKGSDQGSEAFVAWTREHQVEAQFFHADSPDLTADDLRFLTDLEAEQRRERNLDKFDESSARRRAPDFHQPNGVVPNMSADDTQKMWQAELAALEALYRLAELFPKNDWTGGDRYLLRTTHLILPRFEDTPVPPLYEKAHARALEWYRSLDAPEPRAHEPRALVNRKQVQGNILEPYEGMTHGCLALIRIADPVRGRASLLDIARRITAAGQRLQDGEVATNVALTYAGLETLGLSKDELASLPKEFRDGMEARAGWLGDLGPNHPDHWQRPALMRPGSPLDGTPVDLACVDLVLMLQVRKPNRRPTWDLTWDDKHPLRKHLETLLAHGGLDLLAVELQRREIEKDGYIREHFGFRDGISQPKPEGDPSDPDAVSPGEILLGYPNDRGDDGEVEHAFLKNGSFLVVRKLEQDVGRFENILAENAPNREMQEQLAARMMGRFRDGRPLVDDALPPDANDFVYDRERNTPCPASAHIRRANPRTPRPGPSLAGTRPAPIPRIMRRGFSYGQRYSEKARDEERGLFFMAYNASIAEQFEVIQRWMTGGNSSGAFSGDADPFLGLPRPGVPERTFRSVVRSEVERVSLGKHPLVSLRWGMYLFVPALGAFRDLAEALPPRPALPEGEPRKGRELIARLELLYAAEKARHEAALRYGVDTSGKDGDEDEKGLSPEQRARRTAVGAWKTLIEDVAAVEESQDLWAAVRAEGGALRTPYGVLLGSDALVLDAFRDEETYSVREYWDRMEQSIGELYLGMDRTPRKMKIDMKHAPPEIGDLEERYLRALADDRYERESEIPNRWILGITGHDAFVASRELTEETLAKLTRSEIGGRVPVELRRLIGDVLSELSRRWFALPDGEKMRNGGPIPETPAPKRPPEPDDPDDLPEAHCPGNFLSTARYIFSPNPTPFVVQDGRRKGRALYRAAIDYVGEAYENGTIPEGTLFERMAREHPEPSVEVVDLVARTLVGSVHGFVGPCFGTLAAALHLWTYRSRQLWRRQSAAWWDERQVEGLGEGDAARHAPFWNLAHAFVATMQLRPLPYILHRTVLRPRTLQLEKADGSAATLELKPNDRVVLGLLSGTRDRLPVDPTELFGGNRKQPGSPTHACPGQEMAMGTMLGFVWALLHFGPWEVEAPLVLSTPGLPSPPG